MKCEKCNQDMISARPASPVYLGNLKSKMIYTGYCPNCDIEVKKEVDFKPMLSWKQQDKLCYLIGEWYVYTKGDYQGTHHLGRQKEELKDMLCSIAQEEGYHQDPDTLELTQHSRALIELNISVWARRYQHAYDNPDLFIENAEHLTKILTGMKFYLPRHKVIRWINDQMRELVEKEEKTTDFNYGQLCAFDKVRYLLGIGD